MFKRRKPWLVGLLLVVATVVYFVTRGPESPIPNQPGTFSFAVLGDAPYYVWEELQYNLVLQTLDINDLSWVIHVGDIFGSRARMTTTESILISSTDCGTR